MSKPNGKVNGVDRDKLLEQQIDGSFKLDPGVMITLGGKEYTLEYDNQAAKRVVKDTGYNLLADPGIVDALDNPEHVAKILLHGLSRHHPDKFTEEQIDEFLTIKHRAYILRQMIRAMTGFVPDMGDVKQAEAESPVGSISDPM